MDNIEAIGNTGSHNSEQWASLSYEKINQLTDIVEVQQAIIRWAVELLQASNGELFLWDPEKNVLRFSFPHGSEKFDGVTVKPGEGLAGRVFLSGEPLVVSHYDTWEGRLEVFDSAGFNAATLAVPLKWRERTIGVLVMDGVAGQRKFTNEDVHLLNVFGSLSAITLENARIFAGLQENSQKIQQTLEREVAERTAELTHQTLQLQLSAQVSREITSILDIDLLLEQVVDRIGTTFGYYCVQIFLVAADKKNLVLKSSSGENGKKFIERGLTLEIGAGSINGRAACTHAALVSNDVSQDPDFFNDQRLPETRSELVVPLMIANELIGTLDVQSKQLNAFSAQDVLVFQSLGDNVSIALENARLYEKSKEMAALEERNRLARELHDSVTQSLFSMDLHARAVAINIKRNQQVAENQILELRQMMHDTLQNMRSLLYELRPVNVQSDGLIVALQKQIKHLRQEETEIEITMAVHGERRLPDEVEMDLFRIALEALRNALKHAAPSHIHVHLDMTPPGVVLEIKDDGRGFDPAVLPADRHSFGLIGMKERAALLNSTIEIQSAPDAGTLVRVQILI
jgi:signal transduction histidine kinase